MKAEPSRRESIDPMTENQKRYYEITEDMKSRNSWYRLENSFKGHVDMSQDLIFKEIKTCKHIGLGRSSYYDDFLAELSAKNGYQVFQSDYLAWINRYNCYESLQYYIDSAERIDFSLKGISLDHVARSVEFGKSAQTREEMKTNFMTLWEINKIYFSKNLEKTTWHTKGSMSREQLYEAFNGKVTMDKIVDNQQNQISFEERVRGCLYGGAIGDAVGRPLEFLSYQTIQEQYFGDPVDFLSELTLEITDDTQMCLFTAEGLLNSQTDDMFDLREVLQAYHRWLRTQKYFADTGDNSIYTGVDACEIWDRGYLVKDERMNRIEAPGNTCLRSLTAPGTPYLKFGETLSKQYKMNDSKGCGGVMRVAPVGFFCENKYEAFKVGCQTAALTHHHPSGYFSSGALAVIIHELFEGLSIEDSIRSAVSVIYNIDPEEGQETIDAMRKAFLLSQSGKDPSVLQIVKMGGGWTGEEALAIGLYCAMVHRYDFDKAINLSVSHSGDSDSTGAICGNILGAFLGTRGIRKELIDQVEVKDIIERVSHEIKERQT